MIAQAFSRGGLTIRHLGYLANSLSSPNKWMFPVITNKICYLLSYENKIYYLLICLNYRIDFLIKAFSSKKKKKLRSLLLANRMHYLFVSWCKNFNRNISHIINWKKKNVRGTKIQKFNYLFYILKSKINVCYL